MSAGANIFYSTDYSINYRTGDNIHYSTGDNIWYSIDDNRERFDPEIVWVFYIDNRYRGH